MTTQPDAAKAAEPNDGDPIDCPACKGTGRVIHDEEPDAAGFLDDLTGEVLNGPHPSSEEHIANLAKGARIVEFFLTRGWTPPMESANATR